MKRNAAAVWEGGIKDGKGKIPGADKQAFEAAANGAKEGCPVSKLFNAEITLDIHLDN